MDGWDAVAGSLVSGGFSILGGQLDAAQSRQQQRHADDMQRVAWQRDDTAIQRRVADAKAAGLHPLYAVGAQVSPSSTPQYIGGSDEMGRAMGEAGQSIGRAIATRQSETEKMKDQLELKLLTANIGEADARKEYYLSEAARNREPRSVPTGLGVKSEAVPEGQAPNVSGRGLFELVAPQVFSAKVGREDVKAGTNVGLEERMLAPGFPILLPDTGQESPEEVISEMSFPAWLGLLIRNAQEYGEGWLEDMIGLRYGGRVPSRKYGSIREQQEKWIPKSMKEFKPLYADPESNVEYWLRMGKNAKERWFGK